MNQEPNLEELFSNYHPTLSDSDAFMQALSRRLDAVQYVERYQAAQAARYRRYIVIALLVGLVLGGVSLAVFLFLLADHRIETADGVGFKSAHGTASVKNEYELG